MDLKSCLDLLGIKGVPSADEVRIAYRHMVQVWHPDRFQSNPELKRKAEEMTTQINSAYEYIMDHWTFADASRAPEQLSKFELTGKRPFRYKMMGFVKQAFDCIKAILSFIFLTLPRFFSSYSSRPALQGVLGFAVSVIFLCFYIWLAVYPGRVNERLRRESVQSAVTEDFKAESQFDQDAQRDILLALEVRIKAMNKILKDHMEYNTKLKNVYYKYIREIESGRDKFEKIGHVSSSETVDPGIWADFKGSADSVFAEFQRVTAAEGCQESINAMDIRGVMRSTISIREKLAKDSSRDEFLALRDAVKEVKTVSSESCPGEFKQAYDLYIQCLEKKHHHMIIHENKQASENYINTMKMIQEEIEQSFKRLSGIASKYRVNPPYNSGLEVPPL